ncbi:IS4 orf [Shigella dysenteriae]|nr:IS4 orf [Shigella dysenteriae]
MKLKTSPQARKKWPGLGNEVTARLLTVTRKGKVCHLLTSMTDAMRFPEEKWRICTVIAGKSNWDTGR